MQYFILIREWIKNAQEDIPQYLDKIIEKNLICLNSFNNTNRELPLFNGTTERDLNAFFNYIKKMNYKANNQLSFVGKMQIIKNKKNTIYFDSGGPPNYKLSRDYQSGPL